MRRGGRHTGFSDWDLHDVIVRGSSGSRVIQVDYPIATVLTSVLPRIPTTIEERPRDVRPTLDISVSRTECRRGV